jgi:CelD/BcsL family acetyltransferase involved in cellulose biosynthesis
MRAQALSRATRKPSSPPTLDGVEVERLDDPGAVRPGWDRLASASGNPFATPEWTETWLRHAGNGASFSLWACRRADGSLAAVLPLVVVQGRYVRKLRFAGFGAANELGPICAPSDRELGVEALRLTLAATRREWDVFLGENLPGAGWASRLGATLVGREGSPVARGPWESWDAYLATRSRNLRQQLRQKERRLLERGLSYRTVSAPDELEPALDALFELHRGRWGTEASPFFAGQERFHRAFADAAFERGWLRLRLLELDGRPVAANYCLRFGEAEWYYQSGRDLALEDQSVGLLVLAWAIREAFSEEATQFKLGPGLQDYKSRFATDDPGLETVAVPRSLRGRAAILAARRRLP